MPRQIGFFDRTDSPRLKISISGFLTQKPTKFEAVIDTGFSGFISMPLNEALPLGLALIASTIIVLADGVNAYKLATLGKAHLRGEPNTDGVIILEPNSHDVLVGIDFLRKFKKVLFLHTRKSVVMLEDYSVFNDALKPKKGILRLPKKKAKK